MVRRVYDVHAAVVNQRLKSLNCLTSQKLALLDAVIETKKKASRVGLIAVPCCASILYYWIFMLPLHLHSRDQWLCEWLPRRTNP